MLFLDEVERPQYIASVIRSIITHHTGTLDIAKHLPNLPNFHAPSFTSELTSYSSSEEWHAYRDGMVSAQCVMYIYVMSEISPNQVLHDIHGHLRL